MAKYERRLNGNFDEVLRVAHDAIKRSMSATLEDQSSGGSQAMFFKVNTWGEENFLETLSRSMEKYAAGR